MRVLPAGEPPQEADMAADQRIQDCLKLDAEQAARRFFDASPDDAAVKELFEALLDAGEYEKLAEMIFYGSIVRQQSERDYIARSEMKSLDETYFDAFMLLAERAGVDKAKLYPMLAATATASGTLGKWRRPVENRILRMAYADFDGTEALVYAYDADCELYKVLLQADADKATEAIIGRLLFEKGGGKTALRRFLLKTKLDILPQLLAAYRHGDARLRLSVMRILLLYKNDPRAAAVIAEARRKETSRPILRLIESDEVYRGRESSPNTVRERFFEMMVTGRTMSVYDFTGLIRYDRTADTLFFTDGRGVVFIVDKGATLDLDNRPVNITDPVGVLHPALLPAKLSYLKQLNIKQCFPQLHRTVYAPGAAELEYDRSDRLSGTVLPAAAFRRNLKKRKFRLLDDEDGVARQAGLIRDGIVCALSFSPTDFTSGSVKLGEIVFYRYADTVKLDGNIYTEGVRPVEIGTLNPRLFSEFMADVYAAAGL